MAIEDRIKQAADALESEITAGLAGKLRTLAEKISAAAIQERVAAEAEAMAKLASEIASVRDEAERIRQASVAQARSEAEQRFAIELQRVRADADAVKSDADRLKEEVDQARAESNRHKEESERHAQEASRLKNEGEQVRQEFDGLSQEFDRFKEEFGRVKEELGRAQLESRRLKEQSDRFREEADGLRGERDRLTSEVSTALEGRAAERESTIAGLERLATTFRRLDAAGSLTDVLSALAEAAAAETARVALLVASPAPAGAERRFKPWGIYGFPPAPEGFDLPLVSADDLGRTGLPFAPLARSHAGLALPLQVGGQTVAMLYADDGEAEHQAPASWPEAVELLTRHAAARMETVIALRTVQAIGVRTDSVPEDHSSARRYAKLLISEIKFYNEGPIRLGRQHRDLYGRLREEIARARQLFEARVPAHSGGRHVFDDELVHTLADGDASLLGLAQAQKP